jgi:hypothetical protein
MAGRPSPYGAAGASGGAEPDRICMMDTNAQKTNRLVAAATLIIQAALACGLAVFVLRRDWENVFLTVTVIGLILLPAFALRRYRIFVPPEFQLVGTAFVFLSLFLGSAIDFYYRFWWWDVVLHTSSGFLLGMVGWIALFLLNQTDHLPRGIKPSFLCVFGLTFAVTLGVAWEIFEFAVDRIWPSVNMQSNESGGADTMHDLIVNTMGAAVVAVIGWAYYETGKSSFVIEGVRTFLRRNPRLFRRRRSRAR